MLNIIAGSLSVGVTPSTNSYESIATTTVGSGGAANVDFTSIPATYKHLQIRAITRDTYSTYASGDLVLEFNGDTASNYSWHRVYGTGASAAADAGTSANYMILGQEATASSAASIFSGNVIDILEYANTSIYKTARALGGIDLNGGADGRIMFLSGNWRSTSAINSIRLKPASGNFVQYSSFALYGIKGA